MQGYIVWIFESTADLASKHIKRNAGQAEDKELQDALNCLEEHTITLSGELGKMDGLQTPDEVGAREKMPSRSPWVLSAWDSML